MNLFNGKTANLITAKKNILNQNKTDKILKHIATNPDKFKTKTFSELQKFDLKYTTTNNIELKGSYFDMTKRTLQNIINDVIVKQAF